jgi:hypothetical protein
MHAHACKSVWWLQALVDDEGVMGAARDVDSVVAMNARLMTSLRAVVADRGLQVEERGKQLEGELRPQLQARLHA